MSFASSASFVAAKTYLALAAPYLAALAVVLALIAFFLQLSLRRRFAKLALGRAGSLEESIAILTRESKEAKEFRAELEKYLKLAEARLRGAITGVGVVRFNPFEGTGQGGNQSSALAFIDEKGGGVVLSTLYSRDRVAVYAKPVENGASTYELTAEEKQAIEKAQGQIVKLKRGAQ